MIDRLDRGRREAIVLDLIFGFQHRPADDRRSPRRSSGRDGCPAGRNLRVGEKGKPRSQAAARRSSATMQARHRSACSTITQNAVWRCPMRLTDGGAQLIPASPRIAGDDQRPRRADVSDRLSLSIIETHPAPQRRRHPRRQGRPASLRGKTVIGRDHRSPPRRSLSDSRTRASCGGVYIHILAAETLQARDARSILAGCRRSAGRAARRWLRCACADARRSGFTAAALGTFALLLAPTFRSQSLCSSTSRPDCSCCWRSPSRWLAPLSRPRPGQCRYRPAQSRLRCADNRQQRDQALIVARVLNYPQLAATLDRRTARRKLVEQIVARLPSAHRPAVIYPGRRRHFRLVAEPGTPFGQPCRGASSLFRNPARIGGISYDLAVSFGVEIGSGRSCRQPPRQRAGRRRRGRRRRAEVEIPRSRALQGRAIGGCRCSASSTRRSTTAKCGSPTSPSSTSRRGRIVGAEALARWTHPEKGPISPPEFVAAAEQHGRIGKLTDVRARPGGRRRRRRSTRDGTTSTSRSTCRRAC